MHMSLRCVGVYAKVGVFGSGWRVPDYGFSDQRHRRDPWGSGVRQLRFARGHKDTVEPG